MLRGCTQVAVLFVGLAGNLAVPLKTYCQEIPNLCSVVKPNPDDLAPYAKNGPYKSGIKLFLQDRYSHSAKVLAKAWSRLQNVLSETFEREKCDTTGIRKVLKDNIQRNPPFAVPGEDRFLPPPAVRQALAYSLCAAGKLRQAAIFLFEAALAGDDSATASAAMLFFASGRPDICLSITSQVSSGVVALARAYCLYKSGRKDEAQLLISQVQTSRDPISLPFLKLLQVEMLSGEQ